MFFSLVCSDRETARQAGGGGGDCCGAVLVVVKVVVIGVVRTAGGGKENRVEWRVAVLLFASVTISVPVTIEAEFNGQAVAGCWQMRGERERRARE